MKTEKEWDQEIIKITMKIHEEYPELSKYIKEMPQKEFSDKKEGVNVSMLEEYYNSLKELVKDYSKTHGDKKKDLPGYPQYPPSEDIYNKGEKVMDLNPSDLSKKKSINEKLGSSNEKDFKDDKSGSDLDVPGAELDDQQERIGSEDEENNYYSIGGDNHTDLEENRV
ncbi:hypothetical protein SAMN06298216_1810 [Spirosomataceae bacterium TFI 002]|nr:hypothetical protein SAMN06298216_1810 [Spirosomataceae bacterium TFI 002]